MMKHETLDEVTLLASEPGDTVTFDRTPIWLGDALERGDIYPVAGDSVDGTDWVYLKVKTDRGEVLCKTDQSIGLLLDGSLCVDE